MKDFIFSYPTKVYFGKGACKKALDTELKNVACLWWWLNKEKRHIR